MLRQAVFFLILVGTPLASASVYGQMSGNLNGAKEYSANQVIQQMKPDQKAFQGFTHANGQMTILEGGFYYIYAQVFFEPYFNTRGTRYNRVALVVQSNTTFSLMQFNQDSRNQQGRAGSSFTGGIIQLSSGDKIYLKAVYRSALFVGGAHTFFGAYKLN
ncbi:protein eiger-like [Montipora capricornis]|uniref:protein eiger-like n=1 Tax=Montipora capricornis TaxID=246305 RepID=UPI0035F125EA